MCSGCGSCVGQSGAEARIEFDDYGQLQPYGDSGWQGPEAFPRTCPFSPLAADEDDLAAELYPEAPRYPTIGRFLSAHVGFAQTDGFRDRGSSGGMVSWVLEELLAKGLIDGAAHVVPTDPETGRHFRYRISRTSEEIRQGAKSRYYPVDMAEILRTIRETPGRYAVVGVPCFIKAIQLLRREDPVIRERIAFTLGLFCGHMKSARFAESFAMQIGVPFSEVQAVDYRLKDPTRPASTYTAGITMRDGTFHKRDWWNLVDGDWGSGFFQYEACNYCDDVIAETADISFGDAWVEPYSSDGRGTNVIVTRSPVVNEIVQTAIDEGRLCLSPVDEEFIVQTQAAGFRQRREGLAYRLTWRKRGIRPRKRVAPAKPDSRRRMLIYRTRAFISRWSHRMFWLSRRMNNPAPYVRWGRAAVAFYHGFAYSRGKLGAFFDRIGLK
ncbi:coenzyme F420 hydrogenase [bacterium]|nr:MAG: coenzyme F420 hydrogenase [bacterium]